MIYYMLHMSNGFVCRRLDLFNVIIIIILHKRMSRDTNNTAQFVLKKTTRWM